MFTVPPVLNQILVKANELNFTMSCDLETGHLLRALARSKPAGTFLELGTGAGVSTSWIVEGMDAQSTLISVEMDEAVHHIAKSFIKDPRVRLLTMDGALFIEEHQNQKFDFIFADTWPGKYYHLEETLSMVKPGGFYIIDDLTPVESWPEGHGEKAANLVRTLKEQKDFYVVQLNWSTGIIIATRM